MRIAVIVPVHDDAEALARCLISLEGQDRAPDQVIVVDNGSIDASAAVAASHGAHVVSTRVLGIPGATAAGFDHADGDVLARLDADSIAPADWLTRIEAAFADDALAAVSGAATFYGGTTLVRTLGRLSLTVGYFRLIAAVLGHPPLYGSNFALRTDVWRHIRGSVHRERADVHDDLDISLQLPPGALVRYEPDLTVAVSARAFTRPHGTRRQVGMTARTFLVASRDGGLLRRRMAWFLGSTAPVHAAGALRGLEQAEHAAAEWLWGRFSRVSRSKPELDVGQGADSPREVLAEPVRLRTER